MIYHLIDKPVEAVQVTSGMLGTASGWPVWAANFIKVGQTVGDSASKFARHIDGTPINATDYIIQHLDDEDVTVSVSVVSAEVFEAIYNTAS